MTEIYFSPGSMIDSVNSLLRPAAINRFLTRPSRVRLQNSARFLEAWWRSNIDTDFTWEGRVNTLSSGVYKGKNDPSLYKPNSGGKKNAKKKPLWAKIRFEWICCKAKAKQLPCPDGTVRLKSGSVSIRFLSEADGKTVKSFHYDVDPEMANHPFSHLQTNPSHGGASSLNDIPRWPAILMTPVDVIENVFWDLWPREWHQTIAATNVASHLARHHSAQTKRIVAICESFKLNAERPRSTLPKITALYGLRSPLGSVIELR